MLKKWKRILSVTIISLISVIALGTGAAYAASSLLNWTGSSAMTNAGIYIEQSAKKIISITNQNSTLTKEKAELQKEIEQLKQELEEATNDETGWSEKDQKIIDLQNEIISKENEVAYLTGQLEAANSAAASIQEKLDSAYAQLEAAGINIWN